MKKAKFLAMLLFAFVACVGFTSCGDDDNGSNALVGTWVGQYEESVGDPEVVTMTFTKDGKMTASGDYWSFSGSYTTQESGSENVVLISFGGYFAGEDEYYDDDLEFRPCYINGNTLTIFFDGGTCIMVKQ